MAEMTLADLVATVADRFGHYRRSTATAGSVSTIVDTDQLREVDSWWCKHYVCIVEDAGGQGAAPEGEERWVSAFAQASSMLTVSPVFSAAVGVGDVYELLPCRRADIVRAIGQAVRAAGDTWLVSKTDVTTVTIAADDYDYPLPVHVVHLLAAWRRDAATESWDVVPPRDWSVRGTAGGQVLYFHTLQHVEAGDTLRLDYLARLDVPANAGDTLGIGEPAEPELVEFLVDYALYYLHDKKANEAGGGGDLRMRLTQADRAYKRAMERKKRVRRLSGPGLIRSPRWPRSIG